MILGPLSALWRTALPAEIDVEVETVVSQSADAGIPRQSAVRQFQVITRPTERSVPLSQGALLSGVPLLGMSWHDFGVLVAAATASTLLVRGVQIFWENKNRPFRGLKELNHIVNESVVTNEDETRQLAVDLGKAFVRHVRSETRRYEQDHFEVPYTIPPDRWHQIEERRHRLTGNYIRSLISDFQDFGRGLYRLSRRNWENVYKEYFDDFIGKMYVVLRPIVHWQTPPFKEDLDNFDQFRRVLRQELTCLDAKLGGRPLEQVV